MRLIYFVDLIGDVLRPQSTGVPGIYVVMLGSGPVSRQHASAMRTVKETDCVNSARQRCVQKVVVNAVELNYKLLG